MKLEKGCTGCIYSRKYDGSKKYFCASGSRKDGIDTIAIEKSGSKSHWPFSILKKTDISSCTGYVEEKKDEEKK